MFFIWLSIIIAVFNIIVDKSDKQFQTMFLLDYFYSFQPSMLLLLCMPLVLQCHPHLQHQIYDQQIFPTIWPGVIFLVFLFLTLGLLFFLFFFFFFFNFSRFNLFASLADLSFSCVSTTDICYYSNISCGASSLLSSII